MAVSLQFQLQFVRCTCTYGVGLPWSAKVKTPELNFGRGVRVLVWTGGVLTSALDVRYVRPSVTAIRPLHPSCTTSVGSKQGSMGQVIR